MDDFQKREDVQEIIRLRRARQMALAMIKRGREAGIPDKYLRIFPDKFSEVLSPEFHGGKVRGVSSFCDNIYKDQNFLMSRDFISIDGGDVNNRNIAAFAILFRIISYDKRGSYVSCDSLVHKFQTINSTENITRNDLAEELKAYDVLMIGECDRSRFNPHFETGSFFDEVLSDRLTRGVPTIISFVNPISAETSLEKASIDGKLDSGCGRNIAKLCLTPKTTESVLRIRVK